MSAQPFTETFVGPPHKQFLYWIKERYEVFLKKKNGGPKPWSLDPVFQTVYFCNVRREDDKVTQWIRNFYSPHVDDEMFEYNIVLARFLNFPPTLEYLGYRGIHDPISLANGLRERAKWGKIWGSAYIITTCGVKRDKVDYLVNDVLAAVFEGRRAVKNAAAGGRLGAVLRALEAVNGIGSFLAGQIIADLKNTPGHPCNDAVDRDTFVVPGPGSVKGASWFLHGAPGLVTPTSFRDVFLGIRVFVDENWPDGVPKICNQDLQNCLCEFDKFMRVKSGVGRSKRRYPGV